MIHACRGEELSRETALSWVRERILQGLGLEEPPVATARDADGGRAQPVTRHMHHSAARIRRTTWDDHRSSPVQETSQIILFPSSGKKAFR